MVRPDLQSLPECSASAEDAWVRGWMDQDELEGLVEAISRAMAARRPQLAARLVVLLDERVEIAPGSDLDRARRAAALFLMQGPVPDAAEEELALAWQLARRSRMMRIMRRMRGQSPLGPLGLFSGGGGRRGPQLTGGRRR